MRLIDGDALAARLENECREWEGESAYQAGLCAAAAMVAEAPTVCGWISEDRPSKDSADAFVWYTDMEDVEANGDDDDWISVKDRLPENAQNYIICILAGDGTKHVTTGTYDWRYKMWSDEVGRIWVPERVIYWRPFPEPPKEEMVR